MDKVKLTSMRTNRAKVADGAWRDVPGLQGVRLKVRGINHGPYKVARDALLARLSRLPADMPREAQDREREVGFGALYAEHLLLEWEGFDVPYSPAAALEELTNPDAEMMRNIVEQASLSVATPDIEWVEGAVKNSKAPSAGA